METLLQLQDLDLRIERLHAREKEIPLQKGKFEIHRKRLADELKESENRCKKLQLEQRELESEIEQKQTQIRKYDGQLLAVKKNDEYQALLHEMDLMRKQIAIKEERIISVMVEIDDAKTHLEEDKKRIDAEVKEIDRQCALVDAELAEAVSERKTLEMQREPLAKVIAPSLLSRYLRIRKSIRSGPAVVRLNNEHCTGCHMAVPPQIVNEIMAGHKVHGCNHCGRLLFFAENIGNAGTDVD